MNMRATWFLCIVAASALAASAHDFYEGWESAEIADYTPLGDTYISGDEGSWFIGDSISQIPACGLTRNEAQILVQDGSRVLRLLSNRSFTDCADDIWLLLSEFESFNVGFALPLTPFTLISFDERGELEDPQLHGSGADCLIPPCFDNVSVVLTDNNDNVLAYVLQRYPAAMENRPNINYGDTYREVFLDPDAGCYHRNLYNDFRRMLTFNPDGAEIVAIEFRVDQHGWGTLDNLIIGAEGPAGSVPVFRFWSPVTSDHLYTASESERQKLINVYPNDWTDEGIAFYTPVENGEPNGLPVYRFWSPVTSSHFYTMDEAERRTLIDDYEGIWVPEGVAFRAFPEDDAPPGTSPVYRFWSPVSSSHLYTIDEAEREKLLTEYVDVWIPEGVAWYAYPPW